MAAVAGDGMAILLLVTSFSVKTYNPSMAPKRYGQACPVAKAVELLGERWTLLIVRDLLGAPRRFQDLQESLDGIAPNVLSERLKRLEEHGVVTRRLYSEHPPRAEYALTDRGQELGVVVGALAVWGSRHLHHHSALVHAECQHPVEVGYYCRRCAGRVPGGGVALRRYSADRTRSGGDAGPPTRTAGAIRDRRQEGR
jgi:DNA-binding HxlR family transcriptional regulator